ncbi:HyaD/HybD family hydrogenase maturation endopeptidase [Magnetococcus sp. PR-3]|uniref:HyaD/HybD family hydrogenase maturation endopeptidase n=1 Tax=Magnetococcus sp. PR-3 TaxID=3120355 RepID=UPI002FCE5683
MTAEQTLILGIGNTIQKDEGVGVLAVRALESLLSDCPYLSFIDGGTIGFALSPQVEAAKRLVVLDASKFRAQPGTVKVWHNEGIDELFRIRKGSVHELGLLDLLDMARLAGSLPQDRALVAVEPHTIEMGEGLTPAVEAAMPQILREVCQLLDQWHGEGHLTKLDAAA